ncbi:MAG: hypothetical protein JST82_05275 [Bacteroidetes bacterium]|nr:hypothetical protein [Bacteroidota bacterium]
MATAKKAAAKKAAPKKAAPKKAAKKKAFSGSTGGAGRTIAKKVAKKK